MSLKGRVLFITGGSRGIGLEIGKRAAKDGAKVVLAAKTAEPHKLLNLILSFQALFILLLMRLLRQEERLCPWCLMFEMRRM